MSLLNHLPPFILGLIEPGILLYHAIRTYTTLLLNGLLQTGRPPPDLRSKAFGKFWEQVSPVPDPSAPLSGSATLVPPLLSQALGTVLDVGPGSGSLIARFTPANRNITHIYGAEPATALHKTLRSNADATALGNKYTILSADATAASIASALVRTGAISTPDQAQGLFDTVICVRVLCSVPSLRATVSDLHGLLKPGGKLLVCEHTANPWRARKGSVIARAMQSVYMMLGWAYFVGDCELTRDVEDELRREARGRWESVDIERHFGGAVFTYISGVLVKKGN